MKFASLLALALAGISSALGAGFGGLCNTGVVGPCVGLTGNGAGLAPAGLDQSWVLSGGPARVAASIPGAWMANGPFSQWIGPELNANNTSPSGLYTYTLQFMIGSLANLGTGVINGRYLSDNETVSVRLNGQAVSGFPFNGTGSTAFQQWTGFTIPNTANFILGANTLTWVVNNSSFPTGLRVEFTNSSIADHATPEPSTVLLGGLGLLALGMARRRRR